MTPTDQPAPLVLSSESSVEYKALRSQQDASQATWPFFKIVTKEVHGSTFFRVGVWFHGSFSFPIISFFHCAAANRSVTIWSAP